MARTRWPPDLATPASRTGQADQTGHAGGCQKNLGPADRSIPRTARSASADSEVRPGPRPPTLRPNQSKTTEAGPEHSPHPPCRLRAHSPDSIWEERHAQIICSFWFDAVRVVVLEDRFKVDFEADFIGAQLSAVAEGLFLGGLFPSAVKTARTCIR